MKHLEIISPTAPERRRRPRLAPATPDAELAITPSRARILQLVHRFPYSTTQMLGLAYTLGTGRGSSYIQHELGELHHCGYVGRHYAGTVPSGAGSDPYRYTITTKGAKAALTSDELHDDRRLIRLRAEQKKNYDHFTGLSALRLLLEFGPLADEARRRPALPWRLGDFRNDHEHQESRVRVTVAGRAATFWPDAEAVLHHDNARSLWLFEYDRSRKSNPTTDFRFRQYLAHLSGQSLTRLKTQNKVAGVVAVFIAPNEQQRDRLIERARDVIASDHPESPRPLFLFWNVEDWYEERTHTRRQYVGTSAQRTHTWTRQQLKDPRVILAETSVRTVTGKERCLVQLGTTT